MERQISWGSGSRAARLTTNIALSQRETQFSNKERGLFEEKNAMYTLKNINVPWQEKRQDINEGELEIFTAPRNSSGASALRHTVVAQEILAGSCWWRISRFLSKLLFDFTSSARNIFPLSGGQHKALRPQD